MTGRSMLWVRTVCSLCSLCLMLGLAYPGAAHSASPKKTNKVEVAKSKPSRVKAVVTKERRQSLSVTKQRVSKRAPEPSRVAVAKRFSKTESPSVSASSPVRSLVAERATPNRISFGQSAGLQATPDELGLKSNAVMVIDQQTHQVLFDKNASAVLPIASLTKLMTGLVVTDAGLPLDEMITISEEDIDTLKGSGSRLAVGTTLTRGELLHLALMSSENRAAHALGRTFPGGLGRFVEAMNAKSRLIGMSQSRFVDPTGLSPQNQSSAKDLATLASVAYERPVIRDLSVSPSYEVASGNRVVQYHNTNRLVHHPEWEIGLQKTGYISEAGRCLVMQAKIAGRQLIMVFLDSAGKLTRIADAERVRKWMETHPSNLL